MISMRVRGACVACRCLWVRVSAHCSARRRSTEAREVGLSSLWPDSLDRSQLEASQRVTSVIDAGQGSYRERSCG